MNKDPREGNPSPNPGAAMQEPEAAGATTLPFDGASHQSSERFTTIGEELRRERELREITLQEISEDTKISIRNLKAIEDNEFHRLPGGIYTKNFIRAYCRYLGINEEQMVNHYLYQTSPRKEPPARLDGPGEPPSRALRLVTVAVAGTLLAAGAAALVWSIVNRPEWFGFARVPAPAAAASGADRPAAAPLGFHFLAVEDTWIDLVVDGRPRMSRILKRGQDFEVEASDAIVLAVQNAGALQWRINGRQARPLGAEGEVVKDFTVDRGNWKQFLEVSPTP